MEATSMDALVAHCQSKKFTGILRVRAREGIGEVWFLSGIADEVHFGVSTADEAMDRMRNASDAMYELVVRLPHPAGGFKRSFPTKGSIAAVTPVTLMRYCERYALTCTLEIESTDVLIEAKYELGELVSVETTADDDAITAMLEAKEGTYAFTLPHVELPAGTPVLPPSSPLSEPPPESLGFRALLEAKPLVGRTVSDEAEVKRKTVEIARQQKAAAAAPPAKKPEPKKEEPKPVESKPVTTAATAASTSTPPPAVVKPEIKKEEPKPVVASKPVATATPAPTPAPAPATRSVPPRPASVATKPEVKEKEEKVEAKPAPTPEPIQEEKVEAKPAPTDSPIQKEEQPTAAKGDEPAPESVKPAKKPKKRRAKTPPPPPPPEKRSMTWLVVPLLLAAGLAYLYWTHRI